MISVQGLTKVYGKNQVVSNLTFDVKPGVVTGFLGPNGAGKSTTMRMILGLDRPTSGVATINGVTYQKLKNPLTQVGALLDAKWVHPNRSARSHLRWMAAANGIPAHRVDQVLSDVGLTEVAGKKAGGFSLGMSQRLGIAGALLGDPGVLLFDEPVNGLDPEGIVWIRKFMRALADQGRTVLVSSHLLTEMSLTAEHLIVIGRGQLIANSSVKDFTSNAQVTVRVRSPRLGELQSALASAGLRSVPLPDDGTGPALSLENVTTDQVGDIAAANGIGLHELSGKTASLEEVFMSMTAGAVEYHGDSSMAYSAQQQASYGGPPPQGQYGGPPPDQSPQQPKQFGGGQA